MRGRASFLVIAMHEHFGVDFVQYAEMWKLPRSLARHIDGLVQNCSNLSALTVELLQSCA